MIIVNGLLGLIVAPFIILAVGIWMCFVMLKVAFIAVVALGCFVIGLARAIVDQHRNARALRS
jgi:hypothetical protein